MKQTKSILLTTKKIDKCFKRCHSFILLIFFSVVFCQNALLEAQNPEWVVFNCSNMPQLLCPLSFTDFTIDKFNNKWLSTCDTLIKFDDINWFTYSIPDYGSTFCANNICADTNGGIWFIYLPYWDSGIVTFRNDTFAFHSGGYHLIDINIDNKNKIWISYNSFEPYHMHRLLVRKTEDFSYVGDYPDPYGAFKIRCLKNSDTWISLGIEAYNLLLLRNDSCYYYDTTTTHLPSPTFSDACSDNDSDVWFATFYGLLKYNNNEFVLYDSINTSIKLPLRAVACDLNNSIWLGTDSGLIKFDTLNCQVFNSNNSPLPFNKITKVMADKFGNIWMLSEDTLNDMNYLCVYREGGVMLNTTQSEITEQKFYVYPNPASTELSVSTGVLNGNENKIELYNLQGRIMLSKFTKESETILDISQLPAGVYYCVVSNEKCRETVKVVKL